MTDATPSTDNTVPAAARAPRPSDLRDPWVVGGLVLLGVMTVLAILLYRASPQTASEVGSAALVAVAPDAFTPRISRARERVSAAQRARAMGDTAGALARYAEAEEEALTARQQTADTTQTRTATELWANTVLDRAELMLSSGARPWYRADDNQVLAEALAAVRRVQTVPLAAPTRTRAQALAAQIERRMQAGPLEWIPR